MLWGPTDWAGIDIIYTVGLASLDVIFGFVSGGLFVWHHDSLPASAAQQLAVRRHVSPLVPEKGRVSLQMCQGLHDGDDFLGGIRNE